MRLADLFRARDVSRIESLRLVARQAVEGLAVGRHRSPHKGSSVEFKEHRPYVPGDELKNIDWKAFGKSDRLYIREFEEETNLRCMLLVDQSGSMAYGGERARSVSHNAQENASSTTSPPPPSWWDGTKQEYATGLAAAFAYLMLSNQDSVGVMTFDAKVRDYVPPRMLPSHLNVILNSLAQSQRGGETDLGTVLRQASVKLPRRGLVVLISDGFGDVESLGRSLTLLRGGRQDVVFLQVVDPDELDFPFDERIDFRDLERDERHEVIDARQIRTRYLESLHRHNDMIAAACRRNHVDHLLISTDLPLVDCLSRFITLRMAGPVSGAAGDVIHRRTVLEDMP
ncbi:DUF58 domain-containing protein [Allorhodopirellula heiligendammensis]|uniref:VWA domain containing CoxE-like protein n=1 Tax=Allorhodopirellula heiligendammensis TaxID=2714739 RepID=A0A5C6C3C5_9BACT|nr:DUF58 domain-containing protein [Allorhodopirellula heiligendammensis]TWU18121.1 VWA domain containing CoxE-like protein [Allorhodopirellula heiligendammensis]